MKIDLDIDNDPDKDFIKGLLPQMFNKDVDDYVYGWKSKNGTLMTVITEKRDTLRHLVKKYFEEMIMEKGEYACEKELEKMLDEIDRGD